MDFSKFVGNRLKICTTNPTRVTLRPRPRWIPIPIDIYSPCPENPHTVGVKWLRVSVKSEVLSVLSGQTSPPENVNGECWLRSGWWLGPILGGAEVWGYHPKEDRPGLRWGMGGKSQKTVKSVLFHVWVRVFWKDGSYQIISHTIHVNGILTYV